MFGILALGIVGDHIWSANKREAAGKSFKLDYFGMGWATAWAIICLMAGI